MVLGRNCGGTVWQGHRLPTHGLEVLSRVFAALKESHRDEKKYQDERISALQAKFEKFQYGLEAMYEDKLDGRIDQQFYDRKSLNLNLAIVWHSDVDTGTSAMSAARISCST